MPFRRGSRPRGRANNSLALFNTGRSGNNFKNLGSSIRRHNLNVNIASGQTAIDSGEVLYVNVCQMQRTFGSGDDEEPTPTASNNFAAAGVMNGSNIYNQKTSVKIQNEGAQPHYLNVYGVSLSFSDAIYASAIMGNSFPYTMETVDNTPDQRGVITPMDPNLTTFDDTIWRNFMTLQRYVTKIGTINLGTHDSGDRGVAELNFNGVPPKCRKSQTGMYYGYIIQNDGILNNAAAFNGNIIQQTNFEEVPSNNRLPYQW